jgi:hypothetical protein
METGMETGTETVIVINIVKAAGLGTVNTNANNFTVAGYGLTCLKGTSAASLAFLVRMHLHRPLMSSTGGGTSQGIGGRAGQQMTMVQQCEMG